MDPPHLLAALLTFMDMLVPLIPWLQQFVVQWLVPHPLKAHWHLHYLLDQVHILSLEIIHIHRHPMLHQSLQSLILMLKMLAHPSVVMGRVCLVHHLTLCLMYPQLQLMGNPIMVLFLMLTIIAQHDYCASCGSAFSWLVGIFLYTYGSGLATKIKLDAQWWLLFALLQLRQYHCHTPWILFVTLF